MDTLINTETFELISFNSEPSEKAVIYITSKNFDGGAQHVFDSIRKSVSFYELKVDNWDDNLTPWEADAKIKGRTFGGNADKLLDLIETRVIPLIKSNSEIIYIAGYSLAGLFSLWTLYNSDFFAGCACCSGSIWYPGWTEYAMDHEIRRPAKVYLSVGEREKNSKNEYMKKVQDAYDLEQKLLSNSGVHSYTFELNEGGHFNNVNERMIKGINWLTR